ncbi:MAG: hypothetical protein QOH58_1587 [Thermoleophilaceae bacterium]|jgi:D-serine deaminase-like pyridoxal phosphate-dependent protein|nr:hypothetical protein [Thermoleophilaceae bacterium]
MKLGAIDTPALAVDLAAVERNITRMQGYCNEHGLALRPHIKTHKLPQLAKLQLQAGARGVTCQKIGEAEVMADAGIDDILITFPIVGEQKLARLTQLAARRRVSVVADSELVIQGLSRALEAADASVDLLVECDTGQGRAGVQAPQDARRLARLAELLPGLEFVGLMTHPLPDGCGDWFERATALLAEDGLVTDRISVGGTPTAHRVHSVAGVTELRAGTYVYGDRSCIANGSVAEEDCALRVHATVVSTPTATRAVLDCGSKSLSSDPGVVREGGFGLIVELPEATIYELHEEHALVDLSACPRSVSIGDRVTVIPNHVCVTVNLHDEVVVHRDAEVVERWPIAARGRLR